MLVIGISLEPILFLPLARLTEHPVERFDPLFAEFLLQIFAELQWMAEELELQG